MPPKKEESTGTNRNEASSTASETRSQALPPAPKRSSLKATNRPKGLDQPSTSAKQPSERLSVTRSENLANRSKSIRRADNMQRARPAFLTMQMVDFQRRDLFLQITLKDIFFYIIFVIILSIMVLGAFNSSMYYLTRTLTEIFIKKQFYNAQNIPLTFMEITQYDDFYYYCDQILGSAFYTELKSEKRTDNKSSTLKLTKENRLIGLPRIRQVRVKSPSCILGYKFEQMGCFAEFSIETESTAPYHNKHFGTQVWKYSSQSKLQGVSYQGKLSTYNGAGLTENFGKTAEETKKICAKLKRYLWIYHQTRCVFLDFVVYNVNLNLFCVAKLVIEVLPTGSFIPNYSFTTVKLIRYLTKWDYFVRATEWLSIGFLLFFTLEELREIWYFRVLYIFQFWNYLDVAIVLLGYISVAYAIALSYEVEDVFNKNLHVTSSYASFEHVAKLQNDLNNMLAILLFLAYIKIFKYLSFNKTFGQLNNTLQRCALDILAFSIMFFVVFTAYAQLGYFLFGPQIDGFRGVGAAIITLLRTILGDFDFVELKNVHGTLAPIFFFSFIFVVFFVLLNMFLAIINDTYSEVKIELAVAPEEIQMSQFIKRGCFRCLETFGCGGFVPKTAKRRNEYLITVDEIRGALKRSGFTDVEILIFFNRYHIDPDTEDVDYNINTLLAELEDSALKSSTFDFQGAGLITIDDFLLQEVKLHEMDDMVISITEKVDILLKKLDTIDSVRKAQASRRRGTPE